MEDVNRDRFIRFIDIINEPYASWIQTILNVYWREFSSIPATKHPNRHHPSERIYPYGMINHSMRTVFIARLLIVEENLISFKNQIIFSAAFHDLGNIRRYNGQSTYKMHPFESFSMIEELISIPDEDKKMIKNMIENHMHHWFDTHAIDKFDKIIAYADYLASRPEIELNGIEYFGQVK